MKKGFIIVAVLGLFTAASCSKDRTCSCTTVSTSSGSTYTVTSDTTLTDMKKSDAKTTCAGFESTGDVFGVQWTTTCELK